MPIPSVVAMNKPIRDCIVKCDAMYINSGGGAGQVHPRIITDVTIPQGALVLLPRPLFFFYIGSGKKGLAKWSVLNGDAML